MSRPIRFRAWDKANLVMVADFQISSRGGIWLYKGDGSRNNPIRSPLDFELLQFTGLLDKNGKEIYEGDIVIDSNNRKGPVEFQYGCFGWSVTQQGFSTFFKKAGSKFRIIGNIYENPELTKLNRKVS